MGKAQMANLTDAKIRALKPRDSQYEEWSTSGTYGTGRLGVRVYPSGRKTFIFRYYIDKKKKQITIGDYPKISLAHAAELTRNADLQSGHAPIQIQPYATFEGLLVDYIQNQISTKRRGYQQKENRLKQVLRSPIIEPNIPAREVTSAHIRAVLAEFIQRGAIAGSNKVRADLHAAFNFGLFADHDPTTLGKAARYGLTSNPVTPVPKQIGAETIGERVLSWDELGRLLELLCVPDSLCPMNPSYARLLLLCLYTGGQRPWELLANTKRNADLKGATLTIPPELSKTLNFHLVPLSAPALELVKRQKKLHPNGIFLFPADTKEGHLLSAELGKQIRKFCDRTGFEKFTARDIRRTFKTLAGDMGVNLELRDILQNHKRPGVSGRVYDKYYYMREKREIVEQWAERLSQL